MITKSTNNFFTTCFFAALIMLVSTDASYATDYTTVESTLCKLLELLTGALGKAIAAFAIMFIGVSLFMGKVSWGLAISTAIGIGAIFGAAGIVETLGGGEGGKLEIEECANAQDSE